MFRLRQVNKSPSICFSSTHTIISRQTLECILQIETKKNERILKNNLLERQDNVREESGTSVGEKQKKTQLHVQE